MTLDHRQHHLENFRASLSLLLSPLQYAVDLPVAIGNWASETMIAREKLITENRQLREQQLRQNIRLQKLESLKTENKRLRALLQSAERDWERVLIAELLAVDSDPFKHQVLVNKGANNGISEGHPLIDAHGVLGQVIHVAPNTSTAMLITDPSHAIPVQVNRNGLRAIAQGIGKFDSLELPHIPNNADIKIGDLLVTSGLGQRFPPGYPVAIISEIEIDPSKSYARVMAKPTGHLERSREVLLVWREGEPEAGEEQQP